MQITDPEICRTRGLTFAAYRVAFGFHDLVTHGCQVNRLISHGFNPVSPVRYIRNENHIHEAINFAEKSKDSLDMEVDGLVFRVNDLEMQQKMSDSSDRIEAWAFPSWATAYKFGSKGKETVITSVTYQLGRTGVLTPVAYVDPVDIDGATIRKVTLHNQDFMDRNGGGVGVGSRIELVRSGGVIPKITKVLSSGVAVPIVCSECGQVGERRGPNAICVNESCEGKKKFSLIHFAKTMGFKGISNKTIESLMDIGVLDERKDFFTFGKYGDQIVNSKRFGQQSFVNLILGVDEGVFNEDYVLLAALGIKGVSVGTAKKMMKTYGTLEAMILAGREKRMGFGGEKGMKGVGQAVENSVQRWFHNDDNLDELEEIIDFIKEARKGL